MSAGRAIRFIEDNCVYTKGKHYRQPFTLLPWQREWVAALLETDPATGRRVRRWALLGVPKKNGKTELIAALALYFLIADGEPTPDVVCAATKDEQGKLIWGAARTMVEESAYSRAALDGDPPLSQFVQLRHDQILCPENRGRLRVLSGVAATRDSDDGTNLSVLLIDELHAWQGEKAQAAWDTLTGGVIARDDGLVIQITTAGVLDESLLWWREYQHGIRESEEEARTGKPSSYLFRWHSAAPLTEETDWRTEEAARRANPSLDITIPWDNIRDRQARLGEAAYKRYHLNIATAAEESWLGEGVWERCAVSFLELHEDQPAWAAIDLSSGKRRDSTAVVVAQWQLIDGEERLALFARHWQRPDPAPDSWRVPFAEVEGHVEDLARLLDLRGVAYDPMFMLRSAQDLDARGIPMIDFPQTEQRMSAATMNLETLVIEAVVAHAGSPVMAQQFAAAVTRTTSRDSTRYRLTKGNSSGSNRHPGRGGDGGARCRP